MARRLGKPVVAVGGIVDESVSDALNAKFHAVFASATSETLAEALANPAQAVERAVKAAATELKAVLGN